MSERKNLEQLFQEKLEHFEIAPPEELWGNIEMELKKEKDKKRIIPLWWKLSGIAAVVAIGFSVVMNFSDDGAENHIDSNNTDSAVTHQNSQENTNTINPSEKENTATHPSNSEVATVNPSEGNRVETHTKGTTNSAIHSSANDVATVHPSKQKSKQAQNTGTKNPANYRNPGNAIATNPNSNKIPKTKNQKDSKTVNNNEAIVDATQYKSGKNNTTNPKATVGNPIENKSNPQDNQVTLMNKNNGQDDKIAMKNHTDVVLPKGDIKKSDSTSLVNVEPNAMEELLKEKEKQSAQKQKINRWQVTPNLAPIYFGSFSEGSPLDAMLAENDKTYNTSMSYGVGVNYAVNKKIKVRTGINVLSVDYDTQGIVFYQDMNAKTMQNVSPTQQGSMIQIKPLNSVEMQLDKVVSERFDGILNQKMGYIEMPVELSYKLLDKKFGVELMGGFSTLFLNTNEIFLRTDGLNMKIGKATNLNDIHFSSNFGIGLNYKLLKNFDARIEPTFKYQLNTFSSDSGSFKPYIFGIYSGVSYRF